MVLENLFDRKLLHQNQRRFAVSFANHNFLYVEVANRINENLQLLNREFSDILEIERAWCLVNKELKVEIDDEHLPFKNESFDLIISNLNFHFINQIPQFLLQIKNLLKPDGIFIASFFGEENLRELAHILYETENEIYGGISPRMPPTIDIKTSAALLQKAGFQNPIADFEKIEITYENPLNLLNDLKLMGQGNIMTKRSRHFFTKKFLTKVLDNYRKLYGNNAGAVTATFEIRTITGQK